MKRPPRSPREPLFDGGLARHVIWVGLIIGLTALGVGAFYHGTASHDNRWQTMIFTALAFMQMGQALASRSTRASLVSLGLWSNPVLFGLVAVTALLQLMVLYLPFFQPFFQVAPLAAGELLVCAGLGLGMLLLIEVEKAWLRAGRAGR
jgi:Ca2+-transporting ATPase